MLSDSSVPCSCVAFVSVRYTLTFAPWCLSCATLVSVKCVYTSVLCLVAVCYSMLSIKSELYLHLCPVLRDSIEFLVFCVVA